MNTLPSGVTVLTKVHTLELWDTALPANLKYLIGFTYHHEGANQRVFELISAYFIRHERARDLLLALLAIRWFRKSALDALPKDIVRMVTKIVWSSRDDDVWK